MKDKLRAHIEELFAEAPRTNKAFELKEEFLSNTSAKFDDLTARGVSEQDAYKTVISGIGDINELLDALDRDNILSYTTMHNQNKRSALFISIAVGLYIFSIAILIMLASLFPSNGEIGVVAMFTVAAVATSLLVYNGITYKKYRKSDDTIVEEFKEWKSISSEKKQLKKAIESILWPLITAIYFLISFVFGAWAYSWIIFIIGAALDNLINVIINFKD